jgi:trehalose 6-phosphate phosphatase
MTAAVYVGDDNTDVDAFEALRRLTADGQLQTGLCVGVRSDETPRELEDQADVLVDGPHGVRTLLSALAA